jgi:hypothetical protein
MMYPQLAVSFPAPSDTAGAPDSVTSSLSSAMFLAVPLCIRQFIPGCA